MRRVCMLSLTCAQVYWVPLLRRQVQVHSPAQKLWHHTQVRGLAAHTHSLSALPRDGTSAEDDLFAEDIFIYWQGFEIECTWCTCWVLGCE